MKTSSLRLVSPLFGGVLCALLFAASASAEIIGVEAFHYPDGAIAGRSGGTFWDFKNVAPAGHTGTASTWDNITPSPVVAAARLLTDNNSAKREYNGANESQGAVNDANVNKIVYYRVTFTTGATLPDFCVLSSYDGAAERLFFGKLFGQANFTLGINGESAVTQSSVPVLANTTYTMVVKINFSGNTLSLFVNPDLNFSEPDPLISRAFPNVEPSTAIRLASGFAGDPVAWDNLVVATSWEDLGTVVTTAVDEDNGSFSPNSGAGVSLREAVNHSPAGSLITFAPALRGQTCNLAGLELVINRALTIDGPGADLLTVRRAENAASDFRIFNITHPAAIGGLTIAGGRATSAASNGSFGGGIFSRSNLVMTGVHLTDNRASADGGGVGLAFANGTFMGCTFSGNTAGGSGGGINFRDNNTGSTLRLVNSTVSGNRATTRGGGVHHASTGGASTLEVLHCTIFNNTGGGLASFTEASGSTTTATTTLRNSIVATNAPTNLARGATAGGPSGTFTSLNFNLSDNYNGALTTQAQDRTDTPRLAPLALIGGPTPAHALFANSPALDAGNATGATTDQRGLARLFNALGADAVSDGADIGAVEMRPLFVENAADTGTGSLRAAITVANSNGPALDDILFRGTLFDTGQTIDLATALPAFAGSVALHGAGAHLLTVRRLATAATDFRIFDIPQNVPRGGAISGMTVTGGRALGDSGGGIRSQSNLTLTNVHVTGNQANTGGGVALSLADGNFTGSTFSDNVASGSGGNGGGISFQGNGNRTLRVVHCTVSGNQTDGNQFDSFGGGISNVSVNDRVEIISSTIANNAAPTGGGILSLANAGNTATTTLRNTIVANNSPTNLATFGAGNPNVTSRGFNLSNNYNGFLSAPAASDITNSQPRLGPLSLAGGTMPTHALLGGSPALDVGQSSGATTDQRGQARIFDIAGTGPAIGGDHADIGAVEMRPLFVDNAADTGTGSLRQALIDANGTATLDDILFSPSVFDAPQTIELASALPNLGSVALHGPGAHLLTVRRADDAGTNFRIFTIPGSIPGGVAFSGLTIAGGRATGSGNNAFGGGVSSFSSLTLTNVHLTGNTASASGGGVVLGFIEGTFTGCTISGNTALEGAGIAYQGSGGRTLRLINSTVSGNQAIVGGGIHNLSFNGRLEVISSTIAHNTAATGGGIYTGAEVGNTARTTLRNSIIAQNTPTNLAKGGDGSTSVISLGYNLSNSYNSVLSTTASDLTTPVPRLGPLSLGGGTMPTHALLGGSPALDAGQSSGASNDQRGLARIFDIAGIGPATGGDHADIGAVEMRPIFVTNIADNGGGTLRQALIDANATPALDDILFASTFDTARIITLAGALPNITASVALHGPGANLLTVRRGDNAATDFRIFNVPGGVPGGVAFSGLTIAGGRATGSGNNAFGGGVSSFSSLTLTNVHLTGNTASASGGGVNLFGFVEGTFTGCTISGNAAFQGAGIEYQGDGGRTLRLVNSTVSGNQAVNGGGGIFNFSLNARLEITSTTIAHNTAADGGGVRTFASAGFAATTTLRHSIIAQNTPTNLAKGGDGTTTVTSRGFNLASDGGGGFLTATGDQLNADPLLAPLLDFGGPTPTRALRPGSPARNAATADPARPTDQRGFPLIGVPDIGAYEAGTLTNFNAFIYETLPATATIAQHAATFDFDGDGATNEGEFIAGTVVTDPQSIFRVKSVSFANGQFTLRFPTVAGRTYRLEESLNLTDWTLLSTTFPGSGGDLLLTIPAPPGEPRYFLRPRVGP